MDSQPPRVRTTIYIRTVGTGFGVVLAVHPLEVPNERGYGVRDELVVRELATSVKDFRSGTPLG